MESIPDVNSKRKLAELSKTMKLSMLIIIIDINIEQ